MLILRMEMEFLKLNNKADLANYLNITVKQLDFNAYNTRGKYHEFEIPKKNGKTRKIAAPIPSLKSIQKKLSKDIAKCYETKKHVHSYLKNKGIRTNGKVHVKQKYVLNLDLEDFFTSINFGRVSGMFKSYPFRFNDEIANLLSQLCCHENYLPQGSPCSPIITNFICRNLDNKLSKFARQNKCYYSRYSDDITISTKLTVFPSQIATNTSENVVIKDNLKNIIFKNGFTINEDKVSLRRNHEYQYATGLTINEKLNVKRSLLKQVRAMLYAWEKHGLQKASEEHFNRYSFKHKNKKDTGLFIRIIEGKLLFICDIRGKTDPLFNSLLNKFQKLSPNQKLQNYITYQGQKILVYTEGNTDWMHIRNALNALNVEYRYVNLAKAIKLVEYDANYTVGDTKLKEILRGHLVSGNRTPIIGIFDSDQIQTLGEFAPHIERRYNNFDNRVYTFYLPKPSHRKTNENCIEHYYRDKDLTIKDEYGRRLFLSNEFDFHSGELKLSPNIRCTWGQKKLRAKEGIIDSGVRDTSDNSLALSKKDFAKNILSKKENYKAVNVDSFRLIFDIMFDIMRDVQQNKSRLTDA